MESTKNCSLIDAIKVVSNHMVNDDDYREAWKANIAMSFKDESAEWLDHLKVKLPDHYDVHQIANNAADRFLDLLTYQGRKDKCIPKSEVSIKKILIKDKVPQKNLHSICLGAYYVGIGNNEPVFERAKEFGNAIYDAIANFEFDLVRKQVIGICERFNILRCSEVEFYVLENLSKYFNEEQVEDEDAQCQECSENHSMWVRKSNLYHGLIAYRLGDDLYYGERLEPFKKGFEPDEDIVDFSWLDESQPYYWDSDTFEPLGTMTISTSGAGNEAQNDIDEVVEENIKTVDFLKIIEEVLEKLKTTEVPYKDYEPLKVPYYHIEVNGTKSHPCEGCSNYDKMLKGETVVCNCTIPYLNQPMYTFTTGSSTQDNRVGYWSV